MESPNYVRKTNLLYCSCGGEPEYVGSMWLDQYRCNKCHWATHPYYDGEPYAIAEWNKHAKSTTPKG